MKQKHLLTKTLLLLAVMLMGVGTAWGADEKITFSDKGYSNGQEIESVSGTDFTITFDKGTNSNTPKYYTSGSAIRAYGGNTFTVSSTTKTIEKIEITFGSSDGSNEITTDVSNYSDGTWEGSASSVKFTIGGTSGNRRLSAIAVTFDSGSSIPACATPTFSPAAGTYTEAQNVTISTTTQGAKIYYTTDGTDPTINSSDYSSAISVNETTTIKAIAVADGYNNSAVATATYTIVSIEHEGTQNDPYTVADARAAIDVNAGVTGVYATGTVSKIVTEYSTQYENITFDISADGLTTSAQLRAYRCTDENNVDASDVQVGDVVVIKGNLTKYGEIYEFGEGCLLVSLQHPDAPVVPVINAGNVEIACDATSGEIGYTITNPVDGVSLTAIKDANWISDITVYADKVTFTTTANEGNEDRTANITLKYTGAEDKTVTVTQKHYVIDYAELPFEWEGGASADFLALNGVTANGLGSDYAAGNAPYYIKFDGTGDYIQVKTDGQPGKVTIGVKMIGGANTSTITVQESSNGESFNDLEELTISGAQNSTITLETTEDFAEATRYVRLVFTKGSNVGVGAITIAKPSTEPVITVDPDEVNVDADEHDGTLAISYENLTITDMEDFGIQYYDAEGEEIDAPDWIETLVASQDPQIGEGYVVSYYMVENEGEARTAYFRVYALDDDANVVYSNLVTVTQAKLVVDYATLPFNWEGGASAGFKALDGVTTSGLGSDYAAANAPYLIKFDGTGDYIQVKTDGQIFNVTLDVKMIGGANTSTITVQGSADGEEFANVQELEISGSQNDILNLETSNAFDANYRYVRLLFTKGSNVGVGSITINCVKKSISAAGYATYYSPCALDFTDSGLTAYVATQNGNNVTFSSVTTVPAKTGVLLKGDEGDYTINTTDGGNLNAMQNLFTGVLVDTEVAAPIFVLMNGEAGVGFYKTTQTFTVGAHTAYLPADVAGARSFIAIEEATAIEDIAAETMTNGEVYNLQGQRVVKAQKGLYIINGKKMVVK